MLCEPGPLVPCISPLSASSHHRFLYVGLVRPWKILSTLNASECKLMLIFSLVSWFEIRRDRINPNSHQLCSLKAFPDFWQIQNSQKVTGKTREKANPGHNNFFHFLQRIDKSNGFRPGVLQSFLFFNFSQLLSKTCCNPFHFLYFLITFDNLVTFFNQSNVLNFFLAATDNLKQFC